MKQIWFKSSLFEIDPNEDKETNPQIFGKSLAHWLKDILVSSGRIVEEVVPEDWGWCVICSRSPYMLWIGCSNVHNFHEIKAGDPLPVFDDIVWSCFVEAEVPLLKRLFNRVDASEQVTKLTLELKTILESEQQIELVEEP